jgi:hypothetical protein
MSVARQARLWQWAAVAYGVAAVLFLLYFPSVTVAGYQRPLLQVLGPSMLIPISLPVLRPSSPPCCRGRRLSSPGSSPADW